MTPLPERRRPAGGVAVAVLLLALSGCAARATLPDTAGMGPQPVLPAPHQEWIPGVHIAPARGWSIGAAPLAAADLRVTAFAAQLDHPRWLYVLPNGDVLVAESNAPKRPGDSGGLRNWVMGLVMRRAGATVPSADRITLLRDADGDGLAELRTVFLRGLHSPFGMQLVGDRLYVADTDAVLQFPYVAGATHIDVPGVTLLALPAGDINHHWTKNIIASADGSQLFVTVGSNSNAGEHGMAAEAERAAIWVVDPGTGGHRLYASGLRNPNGLAWVPDSGDLWTVVNERDQLGGDLVPDYLTAVHDGAFYGWPYSYFGTHLDPRLSPQRPDLVARALVPDYALGAHTASLGLAWSAGTTLPSRYAHGMFVGQHGSWNRNPRSGYRVIFVPFAGNQPSGPPLPVLGGFLSPDGHAYGRPVGVALDRRGALLVADDVGNTIWRLTPAAGQ